MNNKYIKLILPIVAMSILGIGLRIYFLSINEEKNVLILSKYGGNNLNDQIADGIEWSYEIDLNKKKVTKYCSSDGIIDSEKLRKEYGLNKRKTRKLLDEELDVLYDILSQKEKYKKDKPKDPGYFLYENGVKFYISESDLNANIMKSITEGY